MNGTPTASEIGRMLESYLDSINRCDADVISSVWLSSPQVSYIHPRGHERGFDEVVANFYGQTMDAPFSKRTLTIIGEPAFSVFAPNFAVVEFDWDFVATWRDDGKELHSTGRESHVYGRFADRGWRLVHVHYSGPAKTGAGQGF